MLGLRRVEFFQDESVTSFCSRLAHANRRTMVEFCDDMGISSRGIIEGKSPEIFELARLGGVDASRLVENCTVKIGTSVTRLGELFASRYFNRTNFRFCAHCFEADNLIQTRMPGTRAYGRVNWPSRFLRTCLIHNWSMSDLGPPYNSRLNHDFQACYSELAAEIKQAAALSKQQVATQFERFVQDRLAGKRGHGDFLDTLSLQVGGDLCELVGMSIRDGKAFQVQKNDENDWREAAQLGFERLSKGETGWKAFLSNLCETIDKRKPLLGGNVIFGNLHRLLARVRPGPEYDRIRNYMRDYVVGNLPVTSETVVFGEKLANGRLTPGNIQQRFGRDSRLLQKVLVARGQLAKTTYQARGLQSIDLADAEATVAELSDLVKGLEAARLIGAPMTTFNILVRGGLLEPAVKKDKSIKLGTFYAKSTITRLLGNVLPLKPVTYNAGLYPFGEAAKRANATQLEVLGLLNEKRLANVGIDAAQHGIASLLLDPKEIQQHTILPDHGLYSLAQVQNKLLTSYYVVSGLVDNGCLQTRSARNRVTRMLQRFVDPSDLAAFQATYVSFDTYMKETDTSRPALKKLLESRNVRPAFPVEKIRASFYKRSDLNFPGELQLAM